MSSTELWRYAGSLPTHLFLLQARVAWLIDIAKHLDANTKVRNSNMLHDALWNTSNCERTFHYPLWTDGIPPG